MATNWSNSIELMLLGMGAVFIFLTVLVIGVIIMSAILNKISANTTSNTAPTQSNNNLPETDIAAVAAIAYSANTAQQ